MSQGNRVYVTNARIPIFDFNTEEIRKILVDSSGTTQDILDVAIGSQEILMDIDTHGTTTNEKLTTLVETQLSTNPTVYDFVLNSAQVSVGDSRFRIDPNGRNGWLFINDTAPTTGSSLYWYSNQVPPFGVGTQSNINYNDLKTVYCVVTTNAVASADDLPIIGVYSFPTGVNDGNPSFYHSRWVFTTMSANTRYANEKVLYYYGIDPAIYPELRRVQLTLSNVAPTGPRTNDVIYLMSLNTTSGRSANAVDYIAHATGFHLENGAKREYQFDNSKKRLAETTFSELTVEDGLLQVAGALTIDFPASIDVSGEVSVSNFPATQAISNTNIDGISFTVDKGVNYLNIQAFGIPLVNETVKSSLWDNGGNAITIANPLPVKIMGTSATTYAWTLTDFIPSDGSVGAVSPSINADLYNMLTCFGDHTGTGGTHRLTYQFSLDDITYYDTTFVITLPNSTPFNDTNSLGVPYVRFKLTSNPFTSLTLNVAVK